MLDLKQFRDEINLTKAKATEEKEKLGLDQIVELQLFFSIVGRPQTS